MQVALVFGILLVASLLALHQVYFDSSLLITHIDLFLYFSQKLNPKE